MCFPGLAKKCGFTGLTEKFVFYGNMHFTFCEEKRILLFWRESVFFSFYGKIYFSVMTKKYICKKIEFTV